MYVGFVGENWSGLRRIVYNLKLEFYGFCVCDFGRIVESVGEGIDDFKFGDYVFFVFIGECKECKYCVFFKINLCFKFGMEFFVMGMKGDGKL